MLRRRKRVIRTAAPVMPPRPGRATLALGRLALFATVAAWGAYMVQQTGRINADSMSGRQLVEAAGYMLLVSLLAASASAYLLSRLGYFIRAQKHQRVARAAIDEFFEEKMPSVTVLVPSYREDKRVIEQTLLTAALQEYADLRVVLLIDDPVNPSDPEHARVLEEARALPKAVNRLLQGPRDEFAAALASFERQKSRNPMADVETLTRLAAAYNRAAAWFDKQAKVAPIGSHTERFLAEEFLSRMSLDLRATAEAVDSAAAEPAPSISRRRVHQLYQRLARIFDAEVGSFERKQFANLSQEPNKAMNLNSYLGLMGGGYSINDAPGGRKVLMPAGWKAPNVVIPDSDYVLTLDADTMLLPEYCLRLVYFLEQEGNEDVAVAQTPYSSYRGPASKIERVAGATTDIQHILHQGLTHYNATFWVGANAVIRKKALDELKREDHDEAVPVTRFIPDRTPIEDTESSIDLRARGWRLHNFPERLSYSATPPDFGSLIIQRRRWANGGLIILPALFRMAFARRTKAPRPRPAEFFLRANYLASISWSSAGLVMLLFYPFEQDLLSPWALLTAFPYFLAMASDLKREGYRYRDILGVYGLNLLLLPVNIVGTFGSIMQAMSGRKEPFARTPKVKDRTVAPLTFVLFPLLLIAWSTRTLVHDINQAAAMHALFASSNLLMAAYALVAYIGARQLTADLSIGFGRLVTRPVEPTAIVPASAPWANVVYLGAPLPESNRQPSPLAATLAAQDRFGNLRILPRPLSPAELNTGLGIDDESSLPAAKEA